MSKNTTAMRMFTFVLGTLVSLGLAAAPAQAASSVGPLVASCSGSMEVCYDTHSSWQGGTTAKLRTITSNVSSGTAHYEVRKGSGEVICSGSMGYNATKYCTVGSYTGKLTFGFWKGQNSLTTVSMSAG